MKMHYGNYSKKESGRSRSRSGRHGVKMNGKSMDNNAGPYRTMPRARVAPAHYGVAGPGPSRSGYMGASRAKGISRSKGSKSTYKRTYKGRYKAKGRYGTQGMHEGMYGTGVKYDTTRNKK